MKVSWYFRLLAAPVLAALMLAGCGEDGDPAGSGKYTVEFDANGGEWANGAEPEFQVADKGSVITLPSGSGLTRNGYTFGGWSTSETGTGGQTYSAGGPYTVPGEATMLYAKWNMLSAPTGVAAVRSSATSTTIAVTWNAVSGAASYKIYYSTVGGTSDGYLDGTSNTTSFTSTDNNVGTAYYFGVSAVNSAGGEGPRSAWVQETTAPYTVTFRVNGGSGTAPTVQNVNAGSSTTLPSYTGTKSGYTFGGWNTDSLGTGTNYAVGASFTPTASVTLYAKWNAVTYTVTTFVDTRDTQTYNKVTIGTQTWMAQNLNYDIPGVTTDVCYGNSQDSCVKYGRLYDWATAMNNAPVTSASPSGVQGACPVGWHLPSNAEWATLVTYVGGATTAGKKLKSATGWSSNNGTDDYKFKALPGGGNYAALSGNTGFNGAGTYGYWWTTSQSNNDAANVVAREISNAHDSIRAVSSIKANLFPIRCVENVGAVNTHTVTFSANNGSGTAPGAQNVNAGSSTTLPSGSGLSRDGYTFGGWNTKEDGTGTNYTAGAAFTPTTASVTLYAKWIATAPNTYAVTFNNNGGSAAAPNAQNVTIGANTTLPSYSGTKSGYTFGGWNTKEDGTGTTYAAGATYTPTTASVTLYAKWIEVYIITFNANGGTEVAPFS